MKLAIMQPYFFPYIGYFQLIKAVDTFVIYDDVNYIKNGWINRNSILINNKKSWVTINLKDASSFKLINQIEIGNNKDKVLKCINFSYAKAPFFKEIFPFIEDIINCNKVNLAEFVCNSIKAIAEYLDLKTEFLISSDIEINNKLKGQKKVIDICKKIGAQEYINAIGGVQLYSKEEFHANGIALNFLESKDIEYEQFNHKFVPSLSMIDVLMFNPREKVKEMLKEYNLI
ncbi:MAG: WbqC family protein [Candidatus Omnitrophica bacterium]|jgi:hypothetical protein|nr:WbqC family protein [Candidatus Omnitrophota bacterium]